MSVVRPIVATRSSGPPASGNIIKEMPDLVASGTSYMLLSLSVYSYDHKYCLPVEYSTSYRADRRL